MRVDALGPDDPRWEELVEASPHADVYYRPAYCRAYEAAGHGRAVAVVTDRALFPLLVRPLPFGAEGYDAATPYGYGGVLPRDAAGAPTVPATEVRQLRDWCVANGVVSCLLRLHPLLGASEQLAASDPAGIEIREHGPTTAVVPHRIDPETGRLAGMSKGRKADLTIARRELELVWGADEDALEGFRRVYNGTMRRLGAGDFYLFPPEYYRSLAAGLRDELAVALARRGNDVVGGAIFLADRRFAHYHLSGTTEVGRELKAGTLLVHAGVDWAAARRCELLHLGGGTSGADSLFAFKKSFGGETYAYAFATVVADAERYAALVERRRREAQPPRRDFFPAYRA